MSTDDEHEEGVGDFTGHGFVLPAAREEHEKSCCNLNGFIVMHDPYGFHPLLTFRGFICSNELTFDSEYLMMGE